MKFILHIGMPKSGSTALQQGLAAIREQLQLDGVLYPTSPIIGNTSNFLLAGVMPYEDLPRYLRQSIRRRGGDYMALYTEWLHQIREEAKRIGANSVILSGENLYNITSAEQAQKLREELISLGADAIEVSLYVRKPSDWYLSAAQQVLRASHVVRPAGPVRYREVIETFAEYVSDHISVFEYDRGQFPGGDILQHFLQATLGLEHQANTQDDENRQFNGTISGEGMALLQEYRKVNHPTNNSVFTPDTARFRRAVAEADGIIGGEMRPQLRPELKDRIDHGSADLLWLRDRFGIEFKGIDYTRIASEPWQEAPRKVGDICEIDKKRLRKLLNTAIYLLTSPGEGANSLQQRGGKNKAARKKALKGKASINA